MKREWGMGRNLRGTASPLSHSRFPIPYSRFTTVDHLPRFIATGYAGPLAGLRAST